MNTPFKNNDYNEILVEGTKPYDFDSYPDLWEELNVPPLIEGNYALVEIFRTYWRGFDNVSQYKNRLYSLEQDVREYFETHQEKRIGLHERHDRRIIDKTLDQNHLVMITISDNKEGLQALSGNMPSNIEQKLNNNRYDYRATLVQKQNLNH